MLYGDARIRPRTIALASWMVAFGTLLSATWILSANGWLQDPPSATRRSTASSTPGTGPASCSIPPSPTASRTCCWPC
ncbi:cytochrome ubiquinol oxidase subunit I [Streptomyces sp. NPDC003720]|uniref:cytochrome ubiquinol oxidase subunit I n=1 Tax=Streptomyces sp. NPDC003720 TaxID=3364684 RepID=UPI00367DCD7E